jgi:hypothetical protein
MAPSKNKFTCNKSPDMRTALIQFAYSKEHFMDYDSPEESGMKAFLQLGFKWLFADQCVYIRHTNQYLVIVAVHIDDMAIFSSDNTAMAKIKKELAGYFTITDLGELEQIVEMEVE